MILPHAPRASGGGGAAAPGSVLTEAPFLWTSLLSLLILPGDSGGHSMGARAALGPHPRKFLRGKDQACRLRGGGSQPLGDARG